MNRYIPKNRLMIGAYFIPENKCEQTIQDIADCGIDMIYGRNLEKTTLDLFEKYGVGIILSSYVPFWVGEFGDRAGKMPELCPFHRYEEAAKNFEDHPAIWAIELADEPSSLDFDYCNRVARFIDEKFPNQLPYINIYPNYASVMRNTEEQKVNQLGTATYEEYVQKYCEVFDLDYLCYDFYPYPTNISGFYENFRVAADACRGTGRSLWMILQAVMDSKHGPMTEYRYRCQAYSSMAFGAEVIIWASYAPAWWDNGIVNNDGTKNDAYYALQKVNAEIRVIAEEYMKYRNVATHFIGFGEDHPDMKKVQQYVSKDELSTGVFRHVRADNGAPLIIGQMVSRDGNGSIALMVFAADDPFHRATQTYRLCFQASEGRMITAIGGNGKLPVEKSADGTFLVLLSSNDGVFITAK